MDTMDTMDIMDEMDWLRARDVGFGEDGSLGMGTRLG
jgi:hypothetical protein